MIKMKLSLRIPLTLTVIVVMTGIIVFIRHLVKGQPLPTTYVIIWAMVSVILIAITIWSGLRNKGK